MNNTYDFIIIGAGLAGLTCGYRLKEKGYNVLLLESAKTSGGRIQTEKISGCLSDTGAQFFSGSYPVITQLIKDLKLQERISMLSPQMNFLTGSKNFSVNTANPFSLLTSGLLPFNSYSKLCLRMLSHVFFLKRNNFECADSLSRFDNVSAENYLRNNLDETILKKLFAPFFSGFNYTTPSELSEAMVIRTLGHFLERQRLFGLKNGLAELISGLADRLTIKNDVLVEAIIPDGDDHLVQSENFAWRGKKIILATTAEVAKKLWRHRSISVERLLDVRYSPSTHIGMVFKRHKNYVPHYGNMISTENNKFINVLTFESMKSFDLCTEEFELVHALSSSEGHIYSEKGGDLRDEGLKVLESISPYRSTDLIDLKMTAWNKAIPVFSTGRARLIAGYRKSTSSCENVFLAGDYMGTPCSEGAAESGEFIASLFTKNK